MAWKKLATRYKFWIWIPAILLLTYVFDFQFGLHVKNVKGDFSLWQMGLGMAAFLLFSGLGYFIPDMNEYLEKSHLKITLVGFLVSILFFLILFLMFNGTEARELRAASIESGLDGRLVLGIILGIIITSFGLLTYALNLIITVFFKQHFTKKAN